MGLHNIQVVMNFGKADRVKRWEPVEWVKNEGGVIKHKEEADNFHKKLALKKG